uniref:Uncharacterized protein n=1 Tax=Romanomermis culicivorax TaxID=13658 RepID=A0A915I0S6_ROMCU
MNLTKLSQFVNIAHNGCEIMIQDRASLQKLCDGQFDGAIAHIASLCPMGVINPFKIPTYVWCSSRLLIDYLAANFADTSSPSFVLQLIYSQNAKRLSNLIHKKLGKQSKLVCQWIEH